jgi:hypothetical protein
MDLFRRYGSLLKADGTNQLQRTPPALDEGYIRPDERSLSELLEYARRLAAEIRFYNASAQSAGDWTPMFDPLVDLDTGGVLDDRALEQRIAEGKDFPPHLGLLVAFLRLFAVLQQDLNELPRLHLRHYYEKVLRLSRRQAQGDRVHVLLELARKAAPTVIPAGTLLHAGIDTEGHPLRYRTEFDASVSHAKVAEVRRLVVETDRQGRRRPFVADGPSELEGTSWHTFGRRQLDLASSKRFMDAAEVGFAVASPVLRLAEGVRTVRITADVVVADSSPMPGRNLTRGLDVTLSGAEGWIVPGHVSATTEALATPDGELPRLQLSIEATVDETEPAIVAPDVELHGLLGGTPSPVLRVIVTRDASQYEYLSRLLIQSAEVEVEVEGIRDLVLHGPQGPMSPDGPILPLGSQPRVGAAFQIGSAEVFAKKLSSLDVTFEWQDAPDALYEHYVGYFEPETPTAAIEEGFRQQFRVSLELLYQRSWQPLLNNQELFGDPDIAHREFSVDAPSTFDFEVAGEPYQAHPELTSVERFSASSKLGFIRVVLRGPTADAFADAAAIPYAGSVPFEAFGHLSYSRRYALAAIAVAGGDTDVPLPNEPYTPTLASITLDYRATEELVLADRHSPTQLLLLEPWGSRRAPIATSVELVPALPEGGALHIGLADIEPPGNVSLLFQIDEGTAELEDLLNPTEVEWSYLAGDTWSVLPSTSVLRDETYGFQQPGVVTLSIGADATTGHTAMPTELLWLRARITRDPGHAAKTLDLHAQAVTAVLEYDGSLDDLRAHLQSGLPAETITRLDKRNRAIKQVLQPYRSFGARQREQDEAFFHRSAERLRHRNRGGLSWDYERLVLDAFPEVFKVKCLPNTDAEGNPRAGEVALVIVPDLRSHELANPLEPRANAVVMGRIRDFLDSGLTSPFAKLHAIHPIYERLRVEASVVFRSGLDAGYYARKLDEDLIRYLSPWAFDDGEDIVFGARIHRSEILAFIEELEYIDYITKLELYHVHEGPPRGGVGAMTIGLDFEITSEPSPGVDEMVIGDDFVVGSGVEVAETVAPHTILVSHAQHRILPTEPGDEQCTGPTKLGIGYMTVALDFIPRADA